MFGAKTFGFIIGITLLSVLSGFDASGQESLYQRLGGRQTIHAIVSDFVDITLRDSRIRKNARSNNYMKKCDAKAIKERLLTIVCEESGGPCKAASQRAAMNRSIASLDFTASDWDAMVDDFSAVLMKFHVGPGEQTELHDILSRARAQVVHEDY
jgi:hemoglobin